MARFIFIFMFAGMATGMFVIKNKVVGLEAELKQINDNIERDQKALHVLKAEWTYLNTPERIKELSSRHVHMKALKAEQIISLSAIPFKKNKGANEHIIQVSYAQKARRE